MLRRRRIGVDGAGLLDAGLDRRQSVRAADRGGTGTIQVIAGDRAVERWLPGCLDACADQLERQILRCTRGIGDRGDFSHGGLARQGFLAIRLAYRCHCIAVLAVRARCVDVVDACAFLRGKQRGVVRSLTVDLVRGGLVDGEPGQTDFAARLGFGLESQGDVERRQVALIDLEAVVRRRDPGRYVVQVVDAAVGKRECFGRAGAGIRGQREVGAPCGRGQLREVCHRYLAAHRA